MKFTAVKTIPVGLSIGQGVLRNVKGGRGKHERLKEVSFAECIEMGEN
jgi:hypothetical protein